MSDEERLRRALAKDARTVRRYHERQAVREAKLVVLREQLEIARAKYQEALEEMRRLTYGPRP